eukprot:CAMPEP_0184487008 /NCGR_PEP_ID=MMETSP0113_2-20130426/8917_1 /TAXON_ID=91329 /ORGANISM="Norrisiella sphaerica, Strain BC52" /LENGTH=244 /DNA_ID=CAMNT_0026869115 /DNA_START=231 /DNA_END=965 /DNA_ORIENTATION=-
MPGDFPLRVELPTPVPRSVSSPIPNSPLKEDAFLPTEAASFDLLDTASSDSDGASFGSSPELPSQFCPCCKIRVNLHGISFHNHLVLCLKASRNGSKKFSAKEDRKKINDIRKVISKLNLHLRIGIMESFYRLSRGANAAEPPSPRLLPSGTNAEASDRQVLALLYGNRVNITKSRKRKNSYGKGLAKLPKVMSKVPGSAIRSISLTKTSMKQKHSALESLIFGNVLRVEPRSTREPSLLTALA